MIKKIGTLQKKINILLSQSFQITGFRTFFFCFLFFLFFFLFLFLFQTIPIYKLQPGANQK